MNVMVMERLMSPPSRMHQKLDALPPVFDISTVLIIKIRSQYNDIRILSWTTAEDEEAQSEELVVAHQPTGEEGELKSIHASIVHLVHLIWDTVKFFMMFIQTN